ncbi:DUF6000 family protein [Kitasatospora phosalacinea]|uniref:DUF6000 family protein n=1 Tax=Kitasatospora phosalacinea TaxID=2065 RepID=A0ABW6GVA2_9ACTN
MSHPSAPDPELLVAIERYVKATTHGRGRYLRLLTAGIARAEDREPFLRALVTDAREITDRELGILLESHWRPRLAAAWLIGVDRRESFRGLIGELLLESRYVYAGRGYCFALARLGTEEDARLLTAYLDRYLRRPDLVYDQYWAISALLHIDGRTGSTHTERFLVPGGLWDQWSGGQYEPVVPSCFMDELCAVVAAASETGH